MVIIVSGDIGVGKSTVCRQLVQIMRDNGLSCGGILTFKSGKGADVYAWLAANARRFGFCQTYSPKGQTRPHGYEQEPWHWSYCPIAKRYLNEYAEQITYDHITGFPGAHVAPDLKVIPHYVMGINPDCRKH